VHIIALAMTDSRPIKKGYYIGQALYFLQCVIDLLLDVTFGYTTRYGWRKERKEALKDFEKSAQVVSKHVYNMVSRFQAIILR